MAPPSPTPAPGDRPPRVLVLPSSYMAHERTIGGGERYALEYARALSALVPTTLGLFDLKPASFREGALEIRHFEVSRYTQERMWFPATRATWRALGEFDVIHLMCFPTPLSDALVPLARGRGQTVVLTDVGGGGRHWSGYLQKLHRKLNFHRLAHGLAHLSHYAGRFFSDWSQPQTVLHGGTPEVADSSGAPPQGYALFVGRLLPHKGVLNVIRAVGTDLPLKVVGRPYDPAYFEELQREAAGKPVEFITNASDADLHALYAGANVVLQPSLPSDDPAGDKSELLGLVALEGMAHGRPVIVTRTTSLPELVVDGETGFIVPPHDLPALRVRLELLLRNPGEALRLGAQARHHMRQNFTWPATAGRGLEFYRALRRTGGSKPLQ